MKLTVEVPLGVQGVVERSGCEDLSAHRHLTVRVTFTWSTDEGREVSRGAREEGREEGEEGRREIVKRRKVKRREGIKKRLNKT